MKRIGNKAILHYLPRISNKFIFEGVGPVIVFI